MRDVERVSVFISIVLFHKPVCRVLLLRDESELLEPWRMAVAKFLLLRSLRSVLFMGALVLVKEFFLYDYVAAYE